MTLIIGARCSNGVVIVADSKIVQSGEIFSECKIHAPLTSARLPIVYAAAGAIETFGKFLTHTVINIEERTKNAMAKLKSEGATDSDEVLAVKAGVYSYANQFLEDCEKNLKNIKNTYPHLLEKYGDIDILVAFRSNLAAELHHIDTVDHSASIRRLMVIGSGSPHASILLKLLWDNTLSMQESARIFTFIIKCVEQTQVDYNVGEKVNIMYIPDPLPLDNDGKVVAESQDAFPLEYDLRLTDEKEVLPDFDKIMNTFDKQLDKLYDELIPLKANK